MVVVGLVAWARVQSAQTLSPTESYKLDTASSRVYIKVSSSTRFGHNHGVQGQLRSGSLTLGGSGELVFDMNSFVADTPQARQYVGLDPNFSAADSRKVNANMRGPEVLDVARFPTATCAIKSIRPLDRQKAGEPGRYQFAGQFTLHGVTRPLEFTALVERTERAGVRHVRGTFSVLQTNFGITPYSALAGLVGVADELQIWGDLFIAGSR